MKYKPIISLKRKVMIFDLEKPIYGSYFGVWDKWLKIAKKFKLKIIINSPFGTSTYMSAKEYLDGAERIERFYKNPNEPMIFYCRHLKVDIDEREARKKAQRKIEDVTLPNDVKFKLAEKIKRENPELARKLSIT
jgi:hypothetical protein